MDYKQEIREFKALFKIEGRAADRKVVATLSTETPVETLRGDQILVHTPEAIDLSRFPLPIVNNHQAASMPAIGRAKNPRIVGNALKVDLHFGKSKKAQEAWQDIKDGVARHLSVGFVVIEETAPDYRGVYHVTRWQPMEASIVPVPADINATIGRSASKEQFKKYFNKGENQLNNAASVTEYWRQREFRNFSEQLAAEKALVEIGYERSSGLSVSGDGSMVQTDFRDRLLRAPNVSEIFDLCLKIQLDNDSNTLRLPRFDEKDRTSDNLLRGTKWYYTEEGEAITASQFKVSMDQLELKKVAWLLYMTSELSQDSSAADVVIPAAAQYPFNRMLEDGIVDGPGHGRPLGILNAGCTITVAKESGQTASTVVSENILKIMRHLPAESWQSPTLRWLIHKDVIPEVSVMHKVISTEGIASNLWHWKTGTETHNTLCGIPVIVCSSCKPLGSRGDVILANLGEYLIAHKESQQSTSMHVKFLDDEQAFKMVFRWDGMPAWSKAVSPASGSNNISPFITLAERS